VKSLEVNPCDDTTLIGLLVLALTARNVTIQTDDYNRPARTDLVQSITEGGRLSQDAERMRVVARQILASVLSCTLGRGDSGLVARIAGHALGADAHIGNMATEDFLGCLSKAGIEKVGSSLRVLPRPRAKDTRAEVIKQAAGTTYVHPAAHFALTEVEVAFHQEPTRVYSWHSGGSDEESAEDISGEGGQQTDDADDGDGEPGQGEGRASSEGNEDGQDHVGRYRSLRQSPGLRTKPPDRIG
jgi:ParB family chromosome partitioning protein